jgi:hypothetical protein
LLKYVQLTTAVFALQEKSGGLHNISTRIFVYPP